MKQAMRSGETLTCSVSGAAGVALAISPSLTLLDRARWSGGRSTWDSAVQSSHPASTPLRAVTYVEAPDPDSSSGRWVRSFFRASVAHVE